MTLTGFRGNHLDRRGTLILAVSLATGLGVSFEPALVKAMPQWLHGILSSGIIAGGLAAIVLNFALPGSPAEYLPEQPADVSMRPEIDLFQTYFFTMIA